MLSTIAQVVALVASAYALYKTMIEFSLAKKPRLREDYEFAKKLLTEVDDSTHPMILEKGYIALTGDKELRADEIRYFLSVAAPSSSLRKYSFARPLLSFVPAKDATSAHLRFSDSFANEKKRSRYNARKLIQYWAAAMLAFAPLIFFGVIVKAGLIAALSLTLTCLFAFGILAADSLFDYARALRAEELVQEHGSEL